MINLEKEIEKAQKKKDDAEDDRQRFFLRTKNLSDEDIEDIIKHQQKVRKEKRKIIDIRADLETNFKQYKQKHNIDKKIKKKDESYLWEKLYNKYIFPYLKKDDSGLKEEKMLYEKPITDEFIKEMSYYT
jgi:predicted  nucleic acid-binding Zn-ribbon protein